MRTDRWSIMLVVAAVVLVIPAGAQLPARLDLGAPGEEHRLLDALVGRWEVTLEIPTAPGESISGEAGGVAEWVLDGRFLRFEYTSQFAGRPLTVVRYLGFDRHRGRYIELHFESTHTDVMHSEGDLSPDGATITCWGEHVDVASGTAVRVRTATTLLDRDRFRLEMVYTDGEGRDAKTITLTHRRKNVP